MDGTLMQARDKWHKPRSHGNHFSEKEINLIRELRAKGYGAEQIAKELRCASRTIYVWFKRLGLNKARNSYISYQPQERSRRPPKDESNFIAPVQKRTPSAPNAHPSVLHKLMAGRA